MPFSLLLRPCKKENGPEVLNVASGIPEGRYRRYWL
jgi:hypothetical protein